MIEQLYSGQPKKKVMMRMAVESAAACVAALAAFGGGLWFFQAQMVEEARAAEGPTIDASWSAYVHETLDSASPQPDPSLTSAEVLRLVVRDIASADSGAFEPERLSGLFNFIAPDSKRHFGSLEHFAAVSTGMPYHALVDADSARILARKRNGSELQYIVLTQQNDANAYNYSVTLEYQLNGPFENCWMVKDVFPSTMSVASEDDLQAVSEEILS